MPTARPLSPALQNAIAKAVRAMTPIGIAKAYDVSREARDKDGKWTVSGGQIIDADGRPRVMYHGTPNGAFGNFDGKRRKPDSSYSKNLPPAFFFTPDPERAKRYAGKGERAHLIAAHLSPQNLFDYENPVNVAQIAPLVQKYAPKDAERLMRNVSQGSWIDIETPPVLKAIRELGFDGFNVYERGGNCVALFNPEHIKVIDTQELNKSVSGHDVSGEARVPAGAKGGGQFTKTGPGSILTKDRLNALTADMPANSPTPYAKPAKGIFQMPLSKIAVDPARFQFREAVNPGTGTDDRLAGVEKFDHFLAGTLAVWQDPATGKVFLADGHHRYALAKRLRVREMNVQFIDAPTAKQAMVVAALKNIAEGHADDISAAKLLRTESLGEKVMQKAGLSLSGTLAARALALSRLAPSLWNAVVKGDLPIGRGVTIATHFPGHTEQMALAGMLALPKYKRMRLSDAQIAELAKFVPTAGRQTKTIETLFGEESMTKNLAVEKAQLSAAIRAKLMSDKKLFGFVAKQGRAEALKRGGNSINVSASGKIAEEAGVLAEVYDRLSGYAGPVSALLTAGAKQIAEGGSVHAITEGVYNEVRGCIADAHTGRAGSGDAGSGATDAGGSGEPVADGGLFKSIGSTRIALLFKAVTLQQRAHEAHLHNRTLGSMSCDHEGAEPVKVAGKDGKKYPATYCHKCGRIEMDDPKHHKLASDKVPLNVLKKAVEAGLYKAAGQTWSEKLQASHSGSHWVHLHGKPVLILHDGQQLPESEMNAARGSDVSMPRDESPAVYKKHGTNSPAFKHWFGNSKVVDDDGQPLPCYHGTNDKFNAFDHNKTMDGAFWFSSDKDSITSGSSGAAGTKHVVPVYLKASKIAGWDEYDKYGLDELMQQGYDAVKLDDAYIVFHPNQIKHVHNKGTFDPNNADITKSVHYSAEQLKQKQLRWITVHPGGAEPGTPLLVHDNGEQYTVVGGAGGRLNQQVFQKPKGHDDEKAASRKEKRVEKQKQARAALGEGAAALEDKKQALHAEAKKQTQDLTDKVLEALGPQFAGGDALEKVEKEARKRALKEKTDATEGEQKEFADQAAKTAVQEARDAARQVVQRALNSAALRALGDDDTANAEDFKAKIAGVDLVKKFTPEQLDSFVHASANIAALKGQARAIQRALATGDQDAVQGIQADCQPLTAEEAKKQNLGDYLDGQSVDAHTALVTGSEAASTINQRRNQANGASDGLNSFTASLTGKAILRPDTVKTLGVENSARVAAAYLTHRGTDAGGTAEGLRQRIATQSYASVKAVLDKCGEMDALVQNTKDAAAEGDGSVTQAQASIQAANMANLRYRILGTTRGQLRSAAALAHHLEHPSKRALSLPAGSSAIAAHAFAKGLGLKEGDYAVDKAERGEGGGYKVTVQADDLHKLASPHSQAESDRNAAMDELRQDVEQNPGQWRPQGLNDSVMLQPHQELAVRAIDQNKRMVLNLGAGSGKTAVIWGTASHLLNTGKIDRALITMPAKPRAQQGGESGEISKFLSPEMAKQAVVVQDGADLTRQLRRVASGEVKMLVMSPHLMREKVNELKAAGFGGERSLFMADEAHEFAVGSTEGKGSGMAQAAKQMSGSEYAGYGSGTLLENNASELHSILDLAHPGQYGNQKAFAEEWKRLAQGGNDFFSSEAMRGMRDRLSGGMVSYHKPVTDKTTGEALTLDKKTVTVKASPEQKAAIAKINVQYQKDKKSEDPGIAKAAALRREAATKRVLTLGIKQTDGSYANPKYEAVQQIVKDEQARDPKNRVGIYAFERKPLAAAGKAAGGKFVQVTGDDDDKATAASVAAINDRTNDTNGIMLSNAGNYGLNLQGMDHLVKLHAIDTPSKEDQLDHRHFRTGQTRNVRATTILTDHPSEQAAQFRTTRVKLPEVTLLATLADDSKAASILAPRMKEIEAAAHG